MGYYITNSGRRINIEEFSGFDLYLPDIAHHLTKICRYGGALPLGVHYSVARHSINLCKYAKNSGYSEDIQKALLMHDASEAYLGDIVSSLKAYLPDYKAIEHKLEKIIQYKYGIIHWDQYINRIVKQLDTRIILDEAKILAKYHYKAFTEQMPKLEPLGIEIHPDKNLLKTYNEFLDYCKLLGIEDYPDKEYLEIRR